MLELSYKIALYLHIAAGSVGLLSGAIPMITKKGGKLHKQSGMVFFWSMIVVVLSAATICIPRIEKSNYQFLLTIAVFSFYLTYTSRRYLSRKLGTFNVTDWVITGAAIVCAIIMLVLQNLILAVFAILLLRLCYTDIKTQLMWDESKRKENASYVIKSHLGRMVGAYIATITAVVVVNVTIDAIPNPIKWFGPTAVLLPYIFYWLSKYGDKKATAENESKTR
jgi:uncharacterized membrane protein